jgi:hypothetical protein
MARRPSRSTAGNGASPPGASWRTLAAEQPRRQAVTLAELDDRLSRLTWFGSSLAAERLAALDGGLGRRRNRFAAGCPEIAAGRTGLPRATRVRGLTYLLREVQGLQAELAAKGRLTGTQLTRVRRVFGGHPGPLRDYFVGLAGRSGQASGAMLTALTVEEGLLVQTLKIVRRAPDPVPPLTAGQMRRLSIGQLARLLAAAHRGQREGLLLLGLAAHFYETNPPRHWSRAAGCGIFAHFGGGLALDGIGKGDRALEEYRRAVALDGTRSAFRLRLARRLWETEQYYQAMNEWRSVLGQEPGNIEARLGLARAAAKAGDRAAAAQEYLRILQIVPDQPEARRELGRLGRAPGS